MNSIKPTQIIFTKGMSDCRPSANTIPIGKDATIPVTPTIKERVKPPNFNDSTKGSEIGIKDASIFAIGFPKKIKNKIVIKHEDNKAKDEDFVILDLIVRKEMKPTLKPI